MKISVGISKTVNIGNFENLKPSIKVEDDLLENESYSDGYVRIKKICEKLFHIELRMIEEQQKINGN